MYVCSTRTHHDESDGILECFPGHDVSRLDVFLQQVQNRLARDLTFRHLYASYVCMYVCMYVDMNFAL